MNKKKKASVFAVATQSASIVVELDVNDILQLQADWDERRAEAFLRDFGETIAAEMLASGMSMIAALVV